MPPKLHRETPDRRDERIRTHLPKAREYWSKWPAYLADDDLCQTGEKVWGAVAQLTKAVAAHRGWSHFSHVEIRSVIRQIADESDAEPAIRRALWYSESLHVNFYEIQLDRRGVELGLEDATFLLQTLWNELPDAYTDGLTFAEYFEPE